MFLAFVLVLGLVPVFEIKVDAATTLQNANTTLQNGGDYVFGTGTLTYTGRTYTVAANAVVTVTVPAGANITINNTASGGSPFTLNSGSVLRLIVNGTLTVKGQSGGRGADAEISAGVDGSNAGGTLGYAGIRVPAGATLYASGSGRLNAYGGDAGDGGNASWTQQDRIWSGGGGGAGAGIGGNGGNGGRGSIGPSATGTIYGGAGEAAGNINIHTPLVVYAYGGGGGSGGDDLQSDSGGGGGYPAAGIGGGGGGGGGNDTNSYGVGGFSSGGASFGMAGGVNGMSATDVLTTNPNLCGPMTLWPNGPASSYFQVFYMEGRNSQNPVTKIGGFAPYDYGGQGGAGGAGGTVRYGGNGSNIHAYNGSYITTSASGATGNEWGANQTPIYAQLGYSLAELGSLDVRLAEGRTGTFTFTNGEGTVVTPSNTAITKTSYGLGVGSGAGSSETSNGTYTVATVPSAPTLSSASGTGYATQIAVNWTTPASNGSIITSVEILVDGAVYKTISAAHNPSEWKYPLYTPGQSCSTVLGGLENGRNYKITVRTQSNVGTGATSSAKNATPYTNPEAPVLEATGGVNQVSLSWNAPKNNGNAISKYNVYQVVNGTPNFLVSTTNTYYTHSSLANGTTYYYIVRALNAAGESGNSNTADALTATTPNASSGISGSSGADGVSANLHWQAVTGDAAGGTAVTHYIVSWTPVSAGNSGVAGTAGSTTLALASLGSSSIYSGGYTTTISGLTKGATYNFTVTAKNVVGSGAASGVAQVELLDQPLPVTEVKVDAAANNGKLVSNTVTVSWAAPGHDGGSTITRYNIYVYSAVGAGAESQIGDYIRTITVNASTDVTFDGTYYNANVPSLVNGTTYYFKVTALNGVGESILSDEAYGTPLFYPGKVTNVATNFDGVTTSDTMNVTWDPATPNGGTLDRYYVRVRNVGKGLLNDMEYFTRSGTDTSGNHYDVFTVSGKEITVTYIGGYTGRAAVITGLEEGTNYYIGVIAESDLGIDETNGEGMSSMTSTLDQPYPPQNLSVLPTGKTGELSISWADPKNYGGTPITEYTIRVYDAEGTEIIKEVHTVEELKAKWGEESYTKYVLQSDEMEDGYTYYVTISATNIIGEGGEHTRVEAGSYRSPNSVEDVTGTILEGAQSLKVTWNKPSDDPDTGAMGDGGSPILSYNLYIYKVVDGVKAETAEQTVKINVGDIATTEDGAMTYTFKGLERGVTYVADIRAVNEAGESTYAGESGSITMWTLPAAALYPTADPTNVRGELRITWRATDDNGDKIDNGETNRTDVTDYVIYFRQKGVTSDWTSVAWDKAAANEKGIFTQVITGLINGSEFEVYVATVNGAGETVYADGVTSVAVGVPRSPADAPTVGEIISGDASALISSITAPTDNGGSDIQYYNIYVTEVDPVTEVTIGSPVLKRSMGYVEEVMTEITVPYLENGKKYRVTVTAVNGTGMEGEASSYVIVTAGMPMTPENFSVEPGPRFTAVGTFDPAEGNGSPILYYVAYVDGKLYTNDSGNAVQFPTEEVSIPMDEGGATVSLAVAAVNRVGESAPTNSHTITIGAPTTPEITEFTTGAEGINLTWTACSGNGITMVGYNIYVKTAEGDWTLVAETDASTLTATIAKQNDALQLLAGTDYSVKVTAENLVGESPDSNVEDFCFGVPQPPVIASVVFGDSKLTVSFYAPTDTGVGPEGTGSGTIEKYTVYANGVLKAELDASGNVMTVLDEEESLYQYTVELGDLANGSAYLIQMTATNEHGESPMSEGKTGIPATGASEPRRVIAEPTSDTTISLTWKTPLYNGGDEISNYDVDVYIVGDDGTAGLVTDAVVTKKNNDARATEAEISGLVSGETYYCVVTAENKAGLGAEGKSSTATTFTKPDAPIIVDWESEYNSTSTKYDLTVTWKAPENDGGTPITGYKVYVGNSLKSGGLLSPETTSFTVTGLRKSNYTAFVEVFNMVCNDNQSNRGGGTSTSAYVNVGMLAAPEITKVETTTDTITLTWDKPSGAFLYYKIYDLVAVMNQKGYTTIEEAAEYAAEVSYSGMSGPTLDYDVNTYTFDNCESGMHYYAIRCFDNQLVGGYLSDICQVTLGAAAAPVVTDVTAGYENIDVSFNTLEEAQLNALPLYGYQVLLNGVPYGGTVTMDGSTLAMDTERNIIVDTNLASATGTVTLSLPELEGGEDYKVTVRAVTTNPDLEEYLDGLESNSETVTVWTNPTAPVVLDTTSGDGEFTVKLRASDGMGLPVAGYAVYYENADGEMEIIKTVAADAMPSDMTITVDGIVNGYKNKDDKTGWSYYVAAFTKSGEDTWYSAAPEDMDTVVTGIPGAPVITNATAGDGKITVTYTEPAMDAAIAVQSYNIIYTVNDQSTTVSTNSTATTHTISGLTNSLTYSVKVQAVNSIGEGLESEPVTLIPGTPSAPEILDYVAGNESITVRWRAPASNGGSLASYRVYYTDTRDGSKYYENVDVNLNNLVIEGLDNGIEYTIEVTAFNHNGEGQPSKAIALMPGTVPGAPGSVTATVLTGSSVQLSWYEPADNGGLAVDYYAVTGSGIVENRNEAGYVDANDTNNYTVETDDEGNEIRHYTVTVNNLEAGGSYTFGVKAHNQRDFGEVAASESVTTFTVPDRPEWKALSSMNMVFTAKWTAPENDGGTDVIGYNVYVDGVKVNADTLLLGGDEIFVDENGVVSYTATNPLADERSLILGETYEVSISAVNAVGESRQTSSMEVMIQGYADDSVPGRPGRPTVTRGNQQLEVSWTAPAIEGVIEGIQGYYVYYRVKGSGEDAKSIWIAGDNLSTTITGLANNTTYEVWVVARNKIGNSESSAIVTGTPEEIAAPNAPTNIKYMNNAQMTTMTVSWTASVASEQGGTVYYDLYVNNTGETANYTTTNTYYQLSVVSGTEYKIWVVARNQGGSSARDITTPDITALNWLNVEPTGALGAEPSLNLDRDCNGELDPDQIETAPTAPTGLAASVVGASKIELSWNVPVKEIFEGQKEPFDDIEYYRVYVNGSLHTTIFVEEPATSVNDVITMTYQDVKDDGTLGLRPGTIYSFQVSALNGVGPSELSLPLQIYVQDSLDPTNLTAELGTGEKKYTTIHLDWDEPMNSTGLVPDVYHIQINGLDTLEVRKNTNTGEIATEFSWTQATPNTNYVFRVWAEYKIEGTDSTETSKTTNAVNVSTVMATPGVPQNLVATVGEGSQITLSWDAPESDEISYYYLYKNGELVKETDGDTLLIGGDANSTTYDASGEPQGDYTFNLTAVNWVEATDNSGETTVYTKESAKSNTATASTRTIEGMAPAAPINLGAVADGKAITLTWDAVTKTADGNNIELAEGQELTYDIFMSLDGGTMEAFSGILGDTLRDEFVFSNGTVSYTYTEDEEDSGYVYLFQVCAVLPAVEGDTEQTDDLISALSVPATVSTKQEIPLPGVPENLVAELSEDETAITLTWDPVDGAESYIIYLDAAYYAEVTDFEADAPAYTYEITEGSAKRDFFFQVAAKNGSEETNSAGTAGISDPSVGAAVSLDVAPEMPEAIAAPEIVKSIHSTTYEVIRIYWAAPTLDVKDEEISPEEITGYRIILTEDGTDSSYQMAEKFIDSTCIDPETGLWYFDIDINNSVYPIKEATKYIVTISAWRSYNVDGIGNDVPGDIGTWTIAQNLNVDNNDDWVVDLYPDEFGDGEEDLNPGVLVTLTATVSVGVDVDPTVTIKDSTEKEIEHESMTYTYDSTKKTGALKVTFRVMASDSAGDDVDTYNTKLWIPGCTYVEITDIPMKSSITSIDMDALLGGATLYIGETDGDGESIGAGDLSNAKTNFRATVEPYANGDVDGDGNVGAGDLSFIKTNFRKSCTSKSYDELK